MTEVVLIGGGLANGLIALCLAKRRPEVAVTILESDHRIGGNHVWSFFDSDLSPDQHRLIDPLVCHRWQGHRVYFPKLERRLDCGYISAVSDRLHQVVSGLPQVRLVSGRRAERVMAHRVEDSTGETWSAPCVIDGRGYRPSAHLRLCYQKFVGLEVEIEEPHGLTEPIIMDARGPQCGDYRFVYVLPFGAKRLLIEDTRYSSGAHIDHEALKQAAHHYANQRGWKILRCARMEHGILPVVIGGDVNAFWQGYEGAAPPVGLRGGFFHHTTGYSFADAVRVAQLIAETEPLTSETVLQHLADYGRQIWSERAYYRALNKMLFGACPPDARYRILQRFYRLPQAVIGRFYASRLTPMDKVRIIVGRPPVGVGSALRSLVQSPRLRQQEIES